MIFFLLLLLFCFQFFGFEKSIDQSYLGDFGGNKCSSTLQVDFCSNLCKCEICFLKKNCSPFFSRELSLWQYFSFFSSKNYFFYISFQKRYKKLVYATILSIPFHQLKIAQLIIVYFESVD